MDKIEYIWLEEIRKRNPKFNLLVLEKLIEYLDITVNELYNYSFELERLKNNVNIDKSIIECILDKNIKDEAICVYEKCKELGLKIIDLEDREYPKKLLYKSINIPFCILMSSSKINLNSKNVYLFYDDYYTKYAIKIINYFAKIVEDNKCNVLSEYNFKGKNKIEIVSLKWYLDNIDALSLDVCYIITFLDEYITEFKVNLVDAFVIIEARYESNIVKLVDTFLDYGKDIYVVPSNIFRANGYFSNYLIKQGAQIILNKWDLKYILANIIG